MGKKKQKAEIQISKIELEQLFGIISCSIWKISPD